MENASKALIIAGTILVAVLVIGLGVYIFRTARTDVTEREFSDEELRTFNAQFTAYSGSSMYGREVKTMIQKVVSSNKNHDSNKQVTVRYKDITYTKTDNSNVGLLKLSKDYILDNALYEVTTEVDSKTGIINCIVIK